CQWSPVSVAWTLGGNFSASTPPCSCYTRGARALGVEPVRSMPWTRHRSGAGIMTCAELLDQATAVEEGGPMTLQGKRAIVLGGSSGIGLAATNQLASEGVAVIAASRQPHRAQQSVRAGVELQACDVQDREALQALFAASAPFDILVNA